MKRIVFVLSVLLIFTACKKEDEEVVDAAETQTQTTETDKNDDKDTDKTDENKDDDKDIVDPYALPWNTKYISYKNLIDCNGSYGRSSSKYQLYYKDSLLKETRCFTNESFKAETIEDSVWINDQELYLFGYVSGMNAFAVKTTDGGRNWNWDNKKSIGPPDIEKIHKVNDDLIYANNRRKIFYRRYNIFYRIRR